ncbi:MAG: hypothetical protein J6P40_11660 [Oscillospiraceae bacterium]|nr:hypothetical protein [Oscillospiraceae bacterium]
MEQIELIKRISDLALRCDRNGCLTHSAFLTPAECYLLETRKLPVGEAKLVFSGGRDDCERKVAFFLPYYLQETDFDIGEIIKAVKIRSYFGKPGHRDYLGAVLGLGIERDRIGDLLLYDDTAYLFCLSSVVSVLLRELEKVGRISVKTEQIALADVPAPERKTKKITFTVKSLRLDAVTGDLFGVSRTLAAELIREGAVTLNYTICEKVDAPVKEGDTLSVHGKGKGRISQIGGRSRKDRLFVEAELYL